MFNSKSKYLFLLPIIIMIAFSAFFSRVITEINSELLHEKMIEKRLSIDLIDSQIDKFIEQDADWQEYDYVSIIADSMQNIDSIPLTFAALYDKDDTTINPLSVFKRKTSAPEKQTCTVDNDGTWCKGISVPGSFQ